MNRSFRIGALVALFLLGTAAVAPGKPNIVLVVSDDQGHGEFSCHGNPVLRTPCLDRLHDQSVRFTNFHVAPMCTPTRAQLMTGCDAVRTQAVNVSSGRTLLRRDLATMPQLLRRGGYATALFGKWHLGDNYPYRPQDRGFEEVVTYPSSHIGSVPDFWQNDYFDDTYLHNGRRQAYRGYTTDVFFDEAMAWMRTQKAAGKPFFTYLATAAPHGPHFVPQKYRDAVTARLEAALPRLPKLAPATQRQLASYLAMIENLDENMGRLEDFLVREGLRDDTLLIFLTDNGTTFGDQYFPAGMRGKKVTLWEGGHRVPLFIRWPRGAFQAPRDLAPLTQVQDLLPTVLELAGVSKPEGAAFDGMSLAALLCGTTNDLPDRALFINYSRMPVAENVAPGADPATACEVKMDGAAVLWKQWRWLENCRLYDMQADPLQRRDVAAEQPDIAAALRERLAVWWQGCATRANEPQPVIIGNDAENPALLSACEWWNVFVDQQGQVRRGEKKNGLWHLLVDRAGEYELELRRWPREAALALTAAAPAATLADGRLGPGQALAIAQARLRIAGTERVQPATADAQHVTFRLPLPQGATTLEATFLDAEGEPLLGAYYVYVRRLPPTVRAGETQTVGGVTGQTSQFYVAAEEKEASDDNDGTHAVYQGDKVGPWRTIRRALRVARPGDTIFVGSGRYTEELSITTPRIQLRALDGARPLIDGENARPYGIRNPDTSPAEDVLIEGLEIANHTSAGVMIAGRGSRGVILRGNVVHHARDKGITVHGTGHRIESNVVFMIGNNQEAMGIHLVAADCLVQDNDVFLCKKTAIRDQSGHRNTIQGNLMHQCWTGLDYNGCSGARAFNNYIYDNSQGFNPKHVKGDAGWNLFWHNTIYNSHGPHISIAVNRADNSANTGPDCDYLDIRNNILVKAGHTHLWNKPDIVGDHLTIDHNLYFGPPGRPPFFYHVDWPRGGRPGMTTLEQVRRQTPFEAAGRFTDPLLIDPEGGNPAYPDASPVKIGGAKLDSPLGVQLGAHGVRKPAARFVPVRLKALKASVNENLMGYTTDERYCTGWHSGTETAHQWIVYEIEGAETFTHLILVPVAHKVEFNVRRYEFSVSDDNQTYRRLRAGENNDSGSWFIYEFDQPVSAKFLKFTMVDKFPDDGYTWTLNRLEFDELRAGRFDPPLPKIPGLLPLTSTTQARR